MIISMFVAITYNHQPSNVVPLMGHYNHQPSDIQWISIRQQKKCGCSFRFRSGEVPRLIRKNMQQCSRTTSGGHFLTLEPI